MIQKKSEIEIMKIDMHEALRDHKCGEAKRITEKISDKEKEIAVSNIDLHEKRWKMLSDDQKEKAEKLMNERPMMKRRKMKDKF